MKFQGTMPIKYHLYTVALIKLVIVIPRYEYDIVVITRVRVEAEYESKLSTSVNNYDIIRVHMV